MSQNEISFVLSELLVSFLYMQIDVNGSGYDEQNTYVVSLIAWNMILLDS